MQTASPSSNKKSSNRDPFGIARGRCRCGNCTGYSVRKRNSQCDICACPSNNHRRVSLPRLPIPLGGNQSDALDCEPGSEKRGSLRNEPVQKSNQTLDTSSPVQRHVKCTRIPHASIAEDAQEYDCVDDNRMFEQVSSKQGQENVKKYNQYPETIQQDELARKKEKLRSALPGTLPSTKFKARSTDPTTGTSRPHPCCDKALSNAKSALAVAHRYSKAKGDNKTIMSRMSKGFELLRETYDVINTEANKCTQKRSKNSHETSCESVLQLLAVECLAVQFFMLQKQIQNLAVANHKELPIAFGKLAHDALNLFGATHSLKRKLTSSMPKHVPQTLESLIYRLQLLFGIAPAVQSSQTITSVQFSKYPLPSSSADGVLSLHKVCRDVDAFSKSWAKVVKCWSESRYRQALAIAKSMLVFAPFGLQILAIIAFSSQTCRNGVAAIRYFVMNCISRRVLVDEVREIGHCPTSSMDSIAQKCCKCLTGTPLMKGWNSQSVSLFPISSQNAREAVRYAKNEIMKRTEHCTILVCCDVLMAAQFGWFDLAVTRIIQLQAILKSPSRIQSSHDSYLKRKSIIQPPLGISELYECLLKAMRHRSFGNQSFKRKRYTNALQNYNAGTMCLEGKQHCARLRSCLYGNTAAAHFALLQYPEAIRFCRLAIATNINLKALLRKAKSQLMIAKANITKHKENSMFFSATNQCEQSNGSENKGAYTLTVAKRHCHLAGDDLSSLVQKLDQYSNEVKNGYAMDCERNTALHFPISVCDRLLVGETLPSLAEVQKWLNEFETVLKEVSFLTDGKQQQNAYSKQHRPLYSRKNQGTPQGTGVKWQKRTVPDSKNTSQSSQGKANGPTPPRTRDHQRSTSGSPSTRSKRYTTDESSRNSARRSKAHDGFESGIRSSFVDHYAVLGVPTSASRSEIRKAFHAKALLYHPDKTTSTIAVDGKLTLFHECSESYQVLKDPKRKEAYDILLNFHQNSS